MCCSETALFRATHDRRSSRLFATTSAHAPRTRRERDSSKENKLPGELRGIDLQPLARMGNQHLCSHPKTSPVKHRAAPGSYEAVVTIRGVSRDRTTASELPGPCHAEQAKNNKKRREGRLRAANPKRKSDAGDALPWLISDSQSRQVV